MMLGTATFNGEEMREFVAQTDLASFCVYDETGSYICRVSIPQVREAFAERQKGHIEDYRHKDFLDRLHTPRQHG